MNTNRIELGMNELEQVNGGWDLWDFLMIRFVHTHFVHYNEQNTETARPRDRK